MLLAILAGTTAAASFEPAKPAEPLRFCEEHGQWLRLVQKDEEWVEITRTPGIKVRQPYATFENITGHDLYCGVHRAFLHVDAARKLEAALAALQELHPGYGFLVFDAGRPRHAQQELYIVVKGTAYRHFVAPPEEGSVHSYGMAVDLTITDSTGTPLDMGTGFDVFESRSGEAGESEALRDGTLTRQQVDNRILLRRVMKAGGFKRLDHEWWHFNAEKSKVVREWYEQLD